LKLVSFRVRNFRSVNDSGQIIVSKVTTLVGRNESGKTNLLLALHSLNPPGGPVELSPIKDFPRHRRLSECSPDTPVVETTWELDGQEQSALAKMLLRAAGVTRVRIGRSYKGGHRWVSFEGLKSVEFDQGDILKKWQKLKCSLTTAAAKLEAGPKTQLDTAIAAVEKVVAENNGPEAWPTAVKPALGSLHQAVSSSGAALALSEEESKITAELDTLADSIAADEKAHLDARKWAVNRLPIFVYVDEYPELEGHQNIDEYIHRKGANQRTTADFNFEKLCKVADLDPQRLKDLLAANDHETRNQLANRAGAVVTGEIRRLWKDRALKVRFNPDAAHLDTLISDPNALYDRG
jgi:hypothetical protein